MPLHPVKLLWVTKNGYSDLTKIDLGKNEQVMNLSIQKIAKTYSNGVRAIDNLSLELPKGMFGLLGPNGAGKSSLMRTIATLQLPDTGHIHFKKLDIFKDKIEFRKQLGFLPQEFGVYPRESAQQLLNYFAILKGINSKKHRKIAVDRVLEITNLEEARNKRVSTFSGGMRQRFGIAQLLLNEPKLIIVDEPTAGLDPAERARFLNVLRNIGSDNIVIFSTHLVEDVKELCHNLAVVNKGKLLAQTSPKAAIQQLNGKLWETQLPEEQLKETDTTVLSTHFNDANEVVTRVYSEQPLGELFTPAIPKLEDFYFLTLNRN